MANLPSEFDICSSPEFGNSVYCLDYARYSTSGIQYVRNMLAAMEGAVKRNSISCSFFGIMNGDLLFGTNLPSILQFTDRLVRHNLVSEKLVLVGRRVNAPNVTALATKEAYDAFVEEAYTTRPFYSPLRAVAPRVRPDP